MWKLIGLLPFIGWVLGFDLLALRAEVRELFYHGYHGYLENAFPLDELRPLTCTGLGRDWDNPANIGVNDVLGDFCLTLVDSMDTLLVFGDEEGFEHAVELVLENVDFNISSKIQVFETNIRMLGGLLASHQAATRFPWYKDSLLALAHNLGERLLPAFTTPTGIPWPRINLAKGLVPHETAETNAAAAGSLVLEFAMLSHLTGDVRFERAARKAFFAIWNRRSDINLVGNTIDAMTGLWTSAITGICAGVDSFYEYALKAYILFGDVEYLRVWETALGAIEEHVINLTNGQNLVVHIGNGVVMTSWSDALGAYFPGVAVLSGDIGLAVKTHAYYHAIFSQYGFLPERFDYHIKDIDLGWHPLRPEFIESTYLLWLATRDPYYQLLGIDILKNLQRLRTRCGYGGLDDIRTLVMNDRMESFFLGESVKYLYLMFSPNHPLNKLGDNSVYTTEAHLLRSPYHSPHPLYQRTCPAIRQSSLASHVLNQPDFFWSFEAANGSLSKDYFALLAANGTCAKVPQTTLLELLIPGEPGTISRDKAGNLVIPHLRGQLVLFLQLSETSVRITRVGRVQIGKYEKVILQEAEGLQQSMSILVDDERELIGSTSGYATGSFRVRFNDDGCMTIGQRGCIVERGNCTFSLKARNCKGFAIVVDRTGPPERLKPALDDDHLSATILFGEEAWKVLQQGQHMRTESVWGVAGKKIVNVHVNNTSL